MTGMVREEDKRKQSSGLVNNAHGSQSPSGGMSVEGNTWTKGRLNSWDDTRYFLQLSTFLAQLPELFLQVKTWEWLNSGLLGIYTNIHITDCENCLCIVQFGEDDDIPYAPSFL